MGTFWSILLTMWWGVIWWELGKWITTKITARGKNEEEG